LGECAGMTSLTAWLDSLRQAWLAPGPQPGRALVERETNEESGDN
jgi:hypothetical protein